MSFLLDRLKRTDFCGSERGVHPAEAQAGKSEGVICRESAPMMGDFTSAMVKIQSTKTNVSMADVDEIILVF